MKCYLSLRDLIDNCETLIQILESNLISFRQICGHEKHIEVFVDSPEIRRKIYECVDVNLFIIDRETSSAL